MYFASATIGKHETFVPRYGWLKKGYEAASKDPGVFNSPHAIEILGVGKNMVRSIRFWCQAFNILEPLGKGMMQPTSFGRSLLDNDGWDPYIEDKATIWLLHYQLFRVPITAAAWSLAFNHATLPNFDIKELAVAIEHSLYKYPELSPLIKKNFERDASCIIRTYCERASEDNEVYCPFTELNIITKQKTAYSFNYDKKPDIPPLLLAATCCSYASCYLPKSQRTVSITKLAYDFNSPGIVFRMNETDLGNLLNEEALNIVDELKLVDMIGSVQLHFGDDPEKLYWKLLQRYYESQLIAEGLPPQDLLKGMLFEEVG